MSKNLNQAFIKAYSKEKTSKAGGHQPGSNAGLKVDDFIVRFDTATCVVPTMHAATNQKPQPATPGPTETGPVRSIPVNRPSVAQRPTAFTGANQRLKEIPFAQERTRSSDESSTAASAEEVLRSEIASQMSQAGAWEDQQIDAFIGGFPMISPYHLRPSQGRASERQREQGNGDEGRPRGPHFGRVETREKMFASQRDERRSEQQAARRQPLSVEQETPLLSSPPDQIEAKSKASRSNPFLSAAAHSEDSGGTRPVAGSEFATGAHDMERRATLGLSPLASPALASPVPATPQPAVRASQLSREARVQERGGEGEIFRLDRPSYSPTQEMGLREEYSDSGDLSSEVLEALSSGTDEDIDAQRPAATVNATATARGMHVKSQERDLRQAKVRIFNPVWEVDNFQWPDVCLELLEQRADAMELVARNLMDACQEGLQVLAVTSPDRGQGRTTVALCLAKLAGSRGLNVAIVDGDIENPTLSFQTNLDVEQDWRSAIINQLPLEEVAVHSIGDQVTLLPLTEPIDQSEMSTDDNRIEFMLQELSESFDLVIVDMGHMDSSRSLVTTLGERGVISAVVAVVDYRSSTRQQVDSCLRRIRQTGVASIGLVENFAA